MEGMWIAMVRRRQAPRTAGKVAQHGGGLGLFVDRHERRASLRRRVGVSAYRERAEDRALVQAEHVGHLAEQLMQRMLHDLRLRRSAKVERVADLPVALLG